MRAAPERDVNVTIYDPLVMGVDVARYGDDKSVIRLRRGRDARSIKPLKFRNIDTMIQCDSYQVMPATPS
jgi:hypothetical protein